MAAHRTQTTTQRGNPLLWGLVAIALLVGIILLIVSLLDLAGDNGDPPTEQFGVTVGEIVDNPDEYRDEQITVSGEVNRVLGPFAYTIGGEQFANGGELLVIGPPPPVGEDTQLEEPLQEQDIVQVTGNLRDYDLDQIEQEIETEIEAEIPQDLHDQPVLVAEGTVVTPRVHPDQGLVVSIDEILDDPDEFVGEVVTVEGEITDALDDLVFVLDGSLLVIDSTDTMTMQALEESETADASGEVVILDSDTIQDEVDVDLDPASFEQYDGEPVVIAHAILLLPETAD